MPDDDYYTTVPLPMLRDVNELIQSRKQCSPDGKVEGKVDFEMLVKIYNVWRRYFPEDYQVFTRSVEQIRRDIISSGNKGIARKGSAAIQQQLQVPEKLHTMWVIMFPNLSYDKKFVKELVNYLPECKVTDAKI